jgi:hypothetical protein
MTRRFLPVLGVCAALGIAMMGEPAVAAPFGAAAGLVDSGHNDLIHEAHWRGFRHCHRRYYGRVFCHGAAAYYARPYYARPYYRRYVAPRRYYHRRYYGGPRYGARRVYRRR